jgi:predicted Fe-Mo cluster-binding NifX family protein
VIEMITARKHKVAIATEDGRRITSHFRAAPVFIVCTVWKGRLSETETRVNTRTSAATESECATDCWKVVDEVLDDVRVVICAGMGENAYVGLLRRDILPLLTDEEYADCALNEYLHGRLREQPELVHGHEPDNIKYT